ncbi:MAG: hypothetical protein KDA53_01970, partial [Hyphomonas sp.]|nr:hypothetical protein [Hyphomonas sp.]
MSRILASTESISWANFLTTPRFEGILCPELTKFAQERQAISADLSNNVPIPRTGQVYHAAPRSYA